MSITSFISSTITTGLSGIGGLFAVTAGVEGVVRTGRAISDFRKGEYRHGLENLRVASINLICSALILNILKDTWWPDAPTPAPLTYGDRDFCQFMGQISNNNSIPLAGYPEDQCNAALASLPTEMSGILRNHTTYAAQQVAYQIADYCSDFLNRTECVQNTFSTPEGHETLCNAMFSSYKNNSNCCG